jgi:hypothetical protein
MPARLTAFVDGFLVLGREQVMKERQDELLIPGGGAARLFVFRQQSQKAQSIAFAASALNDPWKR